MLVWQHIAKGTLLDKQGVHEWLTKYQIKACELESIVGYTKVSVECQEDCNACLDEYLDRNTEHKGFNEVRDSEGHTQLRLW